MSENAPKILIVVLIVLVVLFFVGIGVGTGEGIGGFSVESLINRLGSLFPTPAVSPSEIVDSPSGCFDRGAQRIVIPGGGGCALQIVESSATARSLKLEIVAGRIHFELTTTPVEGNDMVVDGDLPNSSGDAQTTLTFFPSGGSFIIDACIAIGSSACVINIVN